MSNAKCPQKIVTPQTYRLIRINKLTRRYTPPNRKSLIHLSQLEQLSVTVGFYGYNVYLQTPGAK